jgi:hypothetical protein
VRLTGVRLWEAVACAVGAVDGELLDAMYALEVRKPAEGDAARACREGEYLGALLPTEALERPPPPYDRRVGRVVAVVLRRCSPLVDIDVWRSRDEQLNLLFVELQVVSVSVVCMVPARTALTMDMRSFGMMS